MTYGTHTVYRVECEQCGQAWSYGPYEYWEEPWMADQQAQDDDWTVWEDSQHVMHHLCPDCAHHRDTMRTVSANPSVIIPDLDMSVTPLYAQDVNTLRHETLPILDNPRDPREYANAMLAVYEDTWDRDDMPLMLMLQAAYMDGRASTTTSHERSADA